MSTCTVHYRNRDGHYGVQKTEFDTVKMGSYNEPDDRPKHHLW